MVHVITTATHIKTCCNLCACPLAPPESGQAFAGRTGWKPWQPPQQRLESGWWFRELKGSKNHGENLPSGKLTRPWQSSGLEDEFPLKIRVIFRVYIYLPGGTCVFGVTSHGFNMFQLRSLNQSRGWSAWKKTSSTWEMSWNVSGKWLILIYFDHLSLHHLAWTSTC